MKRIKIRDGDEPGRLICPEALATFPKLREAEKLVIFAGEAEAHLAHVALAFQCILGGSFGAAAWELHFAGLASEPGDWAMESEGEMLGSRVSKALEAEEGEPWEAE